MGTLTIVRQLLLYANWPRHPLVRHEAEFIPPWADLSDRLLRYYRRLVRVFFGIILLAIGLEAVHQSSTSVFMTMMLLMFPTGALFFLAATAMLMVSWPIPLALHGSMAILRERTSHTWDLLLATPIPRSDLILSKLAVGLARQQLFLTLSALLQVVPILGLLGAVARYMETHELSGVSPMLLVLVAAIGFAIDRVQQLVLVTLLGVLAGLLAENWSLGLAGAAALGALFWLIHNIAAFFVLYLLAGDRLFDPAQALFIGFPSLVFSTNWPLLGIALLVLLLLLQEYGVRKLFGWLVRHLSR